MALRLIRLYTGDDGESHFEEGTLALPKLEGTAHRSRSRDAADVSFVESPRLQQRLAFGPGAAVRDHPQRHAGVRDAARRDVHARSRHRPARRGAQRRWWAQVALHG